MSYTNNYQSPRYGTFPFRLLAKIIPPLCIACSVMYLACVTAAADQQAKTSAQTTEKSLEETWGIRAESVRLSANGFMVDFRYRVIDSGKASALLKEKKSKPRLVDKASGAELSIPELEKVGAMRTSFKNMVRNKVYFMMFANSKGLVKRGSKVAVIIGDFKADDLIVR